MDIFGGSTEMLDTAFVKARSLHRHLFDIKTMEREKHNLSGWVVDLTLLRMIITLYAPVVQFWPVDFYTSWTLTWPPQYCYSKTTSVYLTQA